MELITRDIPHFDGYYSMRSDGVVFSNERIVEDSIGRLMKIKKKQLTGTVNKSKTYSTKENPTFNFRYQGKYHSVYLRFLKAITFPEIYNLPVPDLDGEEWSCVKGLSRYLVSNLGRAKIASEKSVCCGIEWVKSEKLITLYKSKDGYITFNAKEKNKDPRTVTLAKEVYRSFRGLNGNCVVGHIDGDLSNNALSNLFLKKNQHDDEVMA